MHAQSSHGMSAYPIQIEFLHAGIEIQEEELESDDCIVPQWHGLVSD